MPANTADSKTRLPSSLRSTPPHLTSTTCHIRRRLTDRHSSGSFAESDVQKRTARVRSDQFVVGSLRLADVCRRYPTSSSGRYLVFSRSPFSSSFGRRHRSRRLDPVPLVRRDRLTTSWPVDQTITARLRRPNVSERCSEPLTLSTERVTGSWSFHRNLSIGCLTTFAD